MATFLFNVLAVAAVLQAATAAPPVPDSLARLRTRVVEDSTDGQAWLELGRALERLAAAYHRHADTLADTVWASAVVDSADEALARAAVLLTGTRAGDSAAVLRVAALAGRALLAWEQRGVDAAAAAWERRERVRLPPHLEELGENLLRGCPRGGLLLAAGDLDGNASAYMRFVRGLRPDLLVITLPTWRRDAVLRARVARDLRLGRAPRRAGDLAWLRVLVERRPVCASMAFEQPPDLGRAIRWRTRPLLWVAGPRANDDRVPPRDFVFAALRLATDEHDTWVAPVVAVYRRAVRETPALCEPLEVYGVEGRVGCR
ncbi:MAG TPA: hypothetical protein VGA20_00750 [Gemmatimonadales bacterium]